MWQRALINTVWRRKTERLAMTTIPTSTFNTFTPCNCGGQMTSAAAGAVVVAVGVSQLRLFHNSIRLSTINSINSQNYASTATPAASETTTGRSVPQSPQPPLPLRRPIISGGVRPQVRRMPSPIHATAPSTAANRKGIPNTPNTLIDVDPAAAFDSSTNSSTTTSPVSDGDGRPIITIDRSGLMGMKHVEEERLTDLSHKSKVTPMVNELKSQIKIRGPLSVSDYMFQCLQNQHFGYYTTQAPEHIIGGKLDPNATTAAASTNQPHSCTDSRVSGDFITSPELGQIFGEMLGIWVIQTWESLGRPNKWQLLELGPGKGTLMADVLRTIGRFPGMSTGLTVHLCETSTTMRQAQIERLKVIDLVKDTFTKKKSPADIGLEAAKKASLTDHTTSSAAPTPANEAASSTSSTNPFTSSNAAATNAPVDDFAKSEILIQSLLDLNNSPDVIMHGKVPIQQLSAKAADTLVPIHWHSKINQVPTDGGPLIVLAHEFLDALPVYQFQMTDRGWCEKLVDMDEGKGPHHLRFVLSAQPTLASRTFLPTDRFPPESSRTGESIEIGAAGLAAVEDLSRHLSVTGGAALLIDYGTNHPNANTLQAVQQHQFKSVLEEPGQVDLTTLVDFKSIRATVERRLTSPLHVLPLITQSHFLRNLNMAGRLEQIVKDALQAQTLTRDQIQVLIDNAVRMINPDRDAGGMGAHFKVMAIVSQQLVQAENVPFNIPDEVMRQEEEEYQKQLNDQKTNTVRFTAGSSLLPTVDISQTNPPDHVFTHHQPTPTATATSDSSSTPSNLATRTEARRAAARQAAAELALKRQQPTEAESNKSV